MTDPRKAHLLAFTQHGVNSHATGMWRNPRDKVNGDRARPPYWQVRSSPGSVKLIYGLQTVVAETRSEALEMHERIKVQMPLEGALAWISGHFGPDDGALPGRRRRRRLHADRDLHPRAHSWPSAPSCSGSSITSRPSWCGPRRTS